MHTHKVIEAIHASPAYGGFAIAGGGSRAVSRLLEVPGASGTIAEVVVPYAAAAMREYLGGSTDQACAPATARALAMAAFQRALRFPHPEHPDNFGIGCTAALRTLRPKRGQHRAYVGAQTLEATHTWSLELTKGARTRDEEEAVVSALVLHALAQIAGVEGPPLELLPGEQVEYQIHEGGDDWQQLILGEARAVCPRLGIPGPAPGETRIIFPGSFNPFHEGHARMAEYAEAHLGGRVEFEMCVRNVDKPPLNYADIHSRMARFPTDRRIWLTSVGTFADKAEVFPGSVFIVGLDTLVRIADPRFYDNDVADRDAAIERIAAAGCRFLAFGRKMGEIFVDLPAVNLPPALAVLCEAVSEHSFRMDVSSTDLRARAAD